MALSNSVKTWVLDPTVHNSSRTEFRLNPGVLASNLKLIDVGVYSTNIVDRTTGVFYPSILGVLASIKKISLFSGSTMIDEIQELPAYGAVQHLRVSNQAQEDINRFELLNGFSFSNSADDAADNEEIGALTTEASHKDYVKAYLENPANNFRQYHNNQIQIANSQSEGASGMLVLSNYLEFLRSVPVLPNIPDLRLILEWNLTAGDYYVDPDASTAVTPSFNPIRPQLVYEEILGVPAQEGLVKIPYMSAIVERFVVPTAADGTTVTSSFRSGAFRNRFVKDLVMFNKVQTDEGWLRKKERSVAQKGEKIQLVVNARKFLPDQGINQESMKLQYFNDAIGGLNIPLAAAMSSFQDAVGNTNRTLDSQSDVIAHNFSVTGVMINDVVDRLDIEYTRTGSTVSADQTAAFDLLCFGRVNRLLELKDGVVRLSY
jgi:hypothetical protein